MVLKIEKPALLQGVVHVQTLSQRTILEITGRDTLFWYLGLRVAGIIYDKLLDALGVFLQLCLSPFDKKRRFTLFWLFLQREVITLANLITFYGIFLLHDLIYASYLWMRGEFTGDGSFLRIAFYQLLTIFLTDFIDGPAARLNGRVSALGTFLDHYRDYKAVLFALVLLIAATISEGDWQMAIFELFALLGLFGILWYFGKMLWLKYWDTDFTERITWSSWLRERVNFLRNFALNEYQTELSGRIQFFVVAFTVCAGIFHYAEKTTFSLYAFTVSMAVNLLVTGGYFNETYNLYERLYDLFNKKTARLKEHVAAKKQISSWWWIPNTLSCFRGLALLPIALAFPAYPLTALVLLSIASLSDVVDGAIARWKKVQSPTGEWLDPLADKILYLGTLWLLRGYAWAGMIFWLTLPAEMMLMAIRIKWIKEKIGTSAPAKWVGKIKAWTHFSCAYAVMRGILWNDSIPYVGAPYLDVGSVLILLGCILSYASLAFHIFQRKTPS